MTESKDGITRVRNFVQNLKDFSRVDTTQEWVMADLHHGIVSTLNIVNNEIKYKADVVKEFGELPDIECLASQLNQVVMNLVINAAEAITHSHGHIVVSTGCMQVTRAFLDNARVASLPEGEAVYLEVRDNGSGMDRATLDRIFEPFFTTKFTGRGLGLAAVLGIVRAHEGALHVQSDVGHGTTFRLALAPHNVVAKQPPAVAGNHKSPRRNSGRILGKRRWSRHRRSVPTMWTLRV
jgi:signal transduction histidine kinase